MPTSLRSQFVFQRPQFLNSGYPPDFWNADEISCNLDPQGRLCYIGLTVSWYSRDSRLWLWLSRLTPLLALGGLLFLLLANYGKSWLRPPEPHKAQSGRVVGGILQSSHRKTALRTGGGSGLS